MFILGNYIPVNKDFKQIPILPNLTQIKLKPPSLASDDSIPIFKIGIFQLVGLLTGFFRIIIILMITIIVFGVV